MASEIKNKKESIDLALDSGNNEEAFKIAGCKISGDKPDYFWCKEKKCPLYWFEPNPYEKPHRGTTIERGAFDVVVVSGDFEYGDSHCRLVDYAKAKRELEKVLNKK